MQGLLWLRAQTSQRLPRLGARSARRWQELVVHRPAALLSTAGPGLSSSSSHVEREADTPSSSSQGDAPTSRGGTNDIVGPNRRNKKRLRPNRELRKRVIADLQLRKTTLEAKATKLDASWTTTVPVLLQRTPVVMPEPKPWQDAMFRLDHELSPYEGYDYPDSVREAFGEKNAPPHGEELEAKAIPFPLAPRVTEADLSDDRKSMERKLHMTLFLLVKNKTGDWFFPELKLNDDEVLRDAGNRVVKTICGKGLHTYLIGNAPIAVWFHEDDDQAKQDRFVRQFIMKMVIVDCYNTAPVKLAADLGYTDYAWITKGEFLEYVPDDERSRYLTHLLPLDDDDDDD